MGRLGYSSITLTDLTETLPVFLTLESSLSNNIQKKNGSLYTPNFEDGDGVIITPSLFIGSELKEFSKKGLYYMVNGKKYASTVANIISGQIAINSEGQLVIKQNIPESYEISAFIDNFTIGEHGYTTNVKSRNKISIFVLEESSSYTAIISSSRDHFDENNTDKITLTAQFYRGTERVTDATYVWDGLTDNDNSSNDSNISGTGSTLDISRGQVNGTEVISCTMTDNSTDLSFVATKTIRDYVDEYRADLLPSSSLILTPNNSSVELTARIWHKTGIINEGHTFSYEWKLIKSNGTPTTLLENTNLLNIDTTNTFPKENFTIACTITIDGKTTVSAYQNIIYSPIEYTVNVEPKQVWLNVDSDGNYSGTRTFNFNFQLLDKEKNLIPKEKFDGFNGDENGHWFINTETSSENFWNYNLILTITEEDVSNDSQVFQFNYTYLGKIFSEEVYVIKNYAGKDGEPGEDGANGASYTIDLSNSFHTFAGEQAHAIAGQIVSFQIQAYYGDDELAIEDVSWGDAPSGLEIEYDKTTKTVTLTTQSGDFLTEDGNIIFTIKVKKKEGVDTLDFIKIFNYSINYNGKSYYLGFGDYNTITYSPSTQTYNPASIIVKAYSRNINGEASIYTDGIIYYSFDRENWVKLTEEDISNYSNIDNIYIRLYSPLMKPSLSLENNRAYLLDEETIPVLTSLDGVEIGGDNLLRWTKNMPIENNKWSLYSVPPGSIYQKQDGEFNTVVFNESGCYSYIFSPKERIDEEYLNKTFCFSCYAYFDNVPDLTDEPILACQLRLYTNFSDSSHTDRKFYKRIAELSARSVDAYPQFITKETIVSGTWIKIYQTFTWRDFLKEKDSTALLEDCKYFALALYSGSSNSDIQRIVKIKKPKLEIGNIPSEWSASPYDISYENISGVNLINGLSSYILTLDKDNNRQIVTNDLDKNQPYVLSWDSCITGGNKFCWALETESKNENLEIKYYQNFDGSNNQNNYIYTLFPNLVDENWSLSFYFGQIIENSDKKLVVNYNSSSTKVTLNRIKLEKGTVKTPFFLTPEQQTEINNEINENYILIGNQFVELGEDFDTLTGKLNQATVDIDRLQGTITTSSEMLTAHADSIRKIENSITIDPGKEPSIVIKTASQDNTQNQAFFLRLTPSKLSFINQNQNEEKELASMSQDTLTITKSNLIESYVEKDFNIGGLNFKITESGVGVIWDIPNKGEKEWRRK